VSILPPYYEHILLNATYVYRSFFQGLCVLGYCVAPLNIAALIACFVRIIWIRAPIALGGWAWCIWGENRTSSQINASNLMALDSICKFLGRNQNRTAEDSTCCISTFVSRHISLTLDLLDSLLAMFGRLFYFILAWMILIQ
jgi:hypothetical protein